MRLPLILFAVTAIMLSPGQGLAAQWICLRTPQFEFYSTNSEKDSREVIDLLEKTQTFMNTVSFIQRNTRPEASRTPVRIVALSSRSESSPFRLTSHAFGYFRHSKVCNCIFLQDIRKDHRQAAVHEYIHLILRQAALKLPLWLNEGLADFYSSLKLDGLKIEVGGMLPDRLLALETTPLIDLDELFKVDPKSPFYNEVDKVPIFYAESWALVHLLSIDHDYALNFPRFVEVVNKGLTPSIAFAQVYGKSIGDMEGALRAYLSNLPLRSVALESPSAGPEQVEVFSSLADEIQTELLTGNFPGISQQNQPLLH